MKRSTAYALVKPAAGRWPRGAVLAADVLAAVTQPLRLGLDAEDIRRVLPDGDPAEVERIRRATWRSWVRLRAVEAAAGAKGVEWPYPPAIVPPQAAALRPPVVLAIFHLGPVAVLGSLLRQLPGPAFVLYRSGTMRPEIGGVLVAEDQRLRAAAFRGALSALRDGQFVAIAVDATRISTHLDVELLGRSVPLARGAFALARMTGAPIVPVAPAWRGRRVEFEMGDPISSPSEQEMASATARWLEGFVRRHPEELGRRFVDSLGSAA